MARGPIRSAAWEDRSTARVLDASRQRTLRRSRRLVEAALEILQRDGLDGLTVQAVVERTGLSLRAFYQRFAGKDELLLAVFEETIRDAAARFREGLSAVSDPLARLEFVVIAQSAPLSREHLRLAESRPAELRDAMEPFVALLAEIVEEGRREGLIRAADARRLAVLIYHLVSAQIHAVLLGTVRDEDSEKSGEELWQFCLRAIRADS